jgi:hypothetical protein
LDAGASGWGVGLDAGADEAPGAKTPPGLRGALDSVGPLLGGDATGYEAGDDATGDGSEGVPWEGVEGVPAEGLPISPDPAPIAFMAEQPVPVMVLPRLPVLPVMTFAPGLGYSKSCFSAVEHLSAGRLMTNMSGRADKALAALAVLTVAELLPTWMGAQFM